MLDNALAEFLDGTILALDPVERFRRVIGTPDDWQAEFLRAKDAFLCALCSRQTGKSTSTSCLAYDAIVRGQFVLILAPSERQSRELLRKIALFRAQDPQAPALVRSTLTEVELLNGGRVVCVPASSDTLRGFSAADMIILEEAAFASDEAINAILPSRAADGRVLAITTPGGSRSGFFYDVWTSGNVRRITARSTDIPRLSRKVAFDKAHMPATRFAVEHELQWLGSGHQFIAHEVIAAAFSAEVSCLRL